MKLAQLALERGELGATVEHAVASLTLDVEKRGLARMPRHRAGERRPARRGRAAPPMVAHALARVPNPDDLVALLTYCRG
jgi:hypothetical protein